jgi:hypothetical protein
MTFFWVCVFWLAIAAALGTLLGRAIAFANDERRIAARSRLIPDGVLMPHPRSSSELIVVAARRTGSLRAPHLVAIAIAVGLGACAVPTGDTPRVKSESGNSATVEYSGERAGEADQKAREACERSGKRLGRASTKPGATGGSVRSYDCVP